MVDTILKLLNLQFIMRIREENKLTEAEILDIKTAQNVIREGGIIVYPTDTIWGIGCDPKNCKAVQKINALKKRENDKSFIVLVASERQLQHHVKTIPEVAYELMDAAISPTTIVFEEGQNVCPEVMAADQSLGVRFTNDAFCNKLLFNLKHGIVSTSANISNQVFDGNYQNIPDSILKNVDYVMLSKRNNNKKIKASTIIRLDNDGRIKIVRK